EIFELSEPGVTFELQVKRVYPNGSLASHLLGWVNADGFGASGVERSFEARLRDKEDDLKLSIDSRVQFTLEDELQKAIVLHKPLAAIGLVTHIPTGEVLALASWPDFDPNHFSTTTPDHRRNRALIDPYELGSVFKPLTMAMALESGMKMDEINIDVKQKLVIAGREIKDFHPGPSPMNATDILVHSSNKGAARLALRTGAKAQRKYLERFGLLAPAQIELRGSANAYMVSNNWSDIKTATIGFGHGLSVSPLSFVSALSGVVNNGLQVPLTVLPADNDNLVTKYVVSPETSRLVRTAMRRVVIEGSGKKADVPGYGVAGKTGSAEKWDSKLSAYAKDRNVSSFVAVFPWESPQYMVFVLLDEPQGGITTFGWETAGWNAAPAVHNIIERIGPLLDAPYSRPDQVAESELSAQVGE
ncbi:MAG: penicillin-binding protein 2, partial [Robiginitomaculum sp.]|nr:penicillin-binding protein 2 [Robiginitomaculum sp.]